MHDRVQDFAYEQDEGRSADRRHHVRLWNIGENDWLAAATYDRGIGLSLYTLQITHHIGREIDPERDAIGRLVVVNGGRAVGRQSSRLPPGAWHRNGGGDRYHTDGMITSKSPSTGSMPDGRSCASSVERSITFAGTCFAASAFRISRPLLPVAPVRRIMSVSIDCLDAS